MQAHDSASIQPLSNLTQLPHLRLAGLPTEILYFLFGISSFPSISSQEQRGVDNLLNLGAHVGGKVPAVVLPEIAVVIEMAKVACLFAEWICQLAVQL